MVARVSLLAILAFIFPETMHFKSFGQLLIGYIGAARYNSLFSNALKAAPAAGRRKSLLYLPARLPAGVQVKAARFSSRAAVRQTARRGAAAK